MTDIRGGGKAAILLYILVGTLAVYVLVKTVPSYMHYYSLEDEVTQQLNLSSINDDDIIIGDLMNKINDLGLPITKDDIDIIRKDNGSVEIKVSWTDEVDYGYGIKRDFLFSIDVSNHKKGNDLP
ncbi:MAG: hypothetical protein WA666_08545 [Nitrospirota bacterium]